MGLQDAGRAVRGRNRIHALYGAGGWGEEAASAWDPAGFFGPRLRLWL